MSTGGTPPVSQIFRIMAAPLLPTSHRSYNDNTSSTEESRENRDFMRGSRGDPNVGNNTRQPHNAFDLQPFSNSILGVTSSLLTAPLTMMTTVSLTATIAQNPSTQPESRQSSVSGREEASSEPTGGYHGALRDQSGEQRSREVTSFEEEYMALFNEEEYKTRSDHNIHGLGEGAGSTRERGECDSSKQDPLCPHAAAADEEDGTDGRRSDHLRSVDGDDGLQRCSLERDEMKTPVLPPSTSSTATQAQVNANVSEPLIDGSELQRLMEQRRPKDLTGKIIVEDFQDFFMGGFSLVNKGNMEGRTVAIKRLKVKQNEWDIKKWEEKFERQLRREMEVWAALSHPNILEFLGFCTGFGKYKSMVSPWCQFGTSSSYLRPGNNIDVKERLKLVTEVNDGLIYLHRLGIIHGDLKPENILIDDDRHARLCDFGLVRLYSWQGPAGMTTTSPYTGSARYKAPELFPTSDNSKPQATMAGDIYALGCIVLEFIELRQPYHDAETQHIMEQEIKNGKPPADWPPTQDLTETVTILWELMNQCWSRQHEQRPTAIAVGERLRSIELVMDRSGVL